MDNIPAIVEDFFTASATGEATKDKFRDLLPVSIRFLLSSGVGLDDIPSKEQMKQLDEYLQNVPNRMGKSYSASTIGDWKRLTKELFSYTANRYSLKKKGEAQMTIPETTATETAGIIPPEPARAGLVPGENSAVTAEILPEGATETETEAKKRKPGRPTKGDEGRDKKITVNIPTSIFNDIKDMANIDNLTFPDCVNAILEQAVNDRWEDIQAIRQLRARRH
ncbi:MAG: hypothetical protein IJG36_03520 [Synergistaceae bacterium]|nr:hypothetical protein [Synergistaceae bacterium]